MRDLRPLAIARPQPADFPPGQMFEYSNTNYVLLGVIIVIGTNLAASPVDGENAAVVVYKTVTTALYDAPFPGGKPSATGRH
jgi:hypothetical protein